MGFPDWRARETRCEILTQLEAQKAFRQQFATGNYYEHDNIYLNVTINMTHTVAALMKLDLLTEEAMESWRKDYEQNYGKLSELNLDPDSFPEGSFSYITPQEVIMGLSPSASIGVIGGADGPTEIFVTGGDTKAVFTRIP